MANVIHRIFTEKLGSSAASSFVGSAGEIFYDPTDGVLRLSNGTTAGGMVLSSGSGGGGIANDPSKVAKAGDVMTGLLVLSGDPLIALHAATKQYVDNADATKASLVHVHDDRYYTEVEIDSKLSLYSLTTHNHRLDNLANVSISSLVTDQVLKWNGLAWVNANVAAGGSSTATAVQTYSAFPTSPVNGSVFVNDTTNTMYYYAGGGWKALDLQDSYLGDNLDVVTTGAIASQVLTFDGTTWRAANLPSATQARLSTLPDVNVTGAAATQVLTYDGTVWRAAALPSSSAIALDALTDVDTTGQTFGQFLGFDGAVWKPTNLPAVPTMSLSDLSDAEIGGEGPGVGQVLSWSETDNAWTNIHIANLYPNLDQVKDVDINGLTDGEYLKYDATANTWVNGSGTYLFDRLYFDPATNILGLGYGEEMEPRLTTDLSALAGGGGPATEIRISTNWPDNPVEGSVFISDDTENMYFYVGGNWKILDKQDNYISDNEDVDTTGATSGQVLTFDGTYWKPATPAAGGSPTAAKAMITMPADNIDLATAAYFKKTITGATTLTVSNAPAAGTVGSFMLELVNPASNITWFAGIKWPGGIVPALSATGTDVLGFTTYDGGASFIGLLISKAIA